MELHLSWNGHRFLFPIPFASPSLRLGQERTRSLAPPCSSKGSGSGICNNFWNHTQSHSGFTRATATLFMSLPYHVPAPANMGLVPSLALQKVDLPIKEGHFPHSNGKTRPRWFPTSYILFQQRISLQAISFQWEWEDYFPICSTQHRFLYTAWYRQSSCETSESSPMSSSVPPYQAFFRGIRPPEQPAAHQPRDKINHTK